LRQHAVSKGIGGERLIFAPKMQNALHLARYGLADLFLDTVPYGAHTTASDALWMGVPVLTLSGRSFASRVCGSLVRSAGIKELVVLTPEAYVKKAVELALNKPQVEAFKTKLLRNRLKCDLFNMDLLVESLEALYREMCEDHRRGRLPQPDLRNLDRYLEVGLGLDHEGQELLAVADYEQLYKEGLMRQHWARAIAADARLWSAKDIEAAEQALRTQVQPVAEAVVEKPIRKKQAARR